jgi:pimeloyl-ACP methyl ester carboxylesterase
VSRASGFRSVSARQAYCQLYDEAIALSSTPVTELDIETSFGMTHVLQAGEETKPPLVALHAFAFSSTMWLPLLPILTARHRVHLVDTVGELSKSVARQVLSSPGKVVSWLDQATNALAIQRSPIVGASMGTWMAAQYAIARPSRVERLALLCPAGIVSRQHPQWLLRAFATAVRPTPERYARFVDSMVMPATRPALRQPPWRPVVQQFCVGTCGFRARLNEARPTPCHVEQLAGRDIPVLFVIGEGETLHDGPLMAERLGSKLPRARVELIKDANHLLFIDQTAPVAQLLGEFLGEDPVGPHQTTQATPG